MRALLLALLVGVLGCGDRASNHPPSLAEPVLAPRLDHADVRIYPTDPAVRRGGALQLFAEVAEGGVNQLMEWSLPDPSCGSLVVEQFMARFLAPETSRTCVIRVTSLVLEDRITELHVHVTDSVGADVSVHPPGLPTERGLSTALPVPRGSTRAYALVDDPSPRAPVTMGTEWLLVGRDAHGGAKLELSDDGRLHATDDRGWGVLVAKAADGRATVASVRVVD